MSQESKRKMLLSGVLCVLFFLFMALVMTVDVQPVGPQGTEVGFGAFNTLVHKTLGVSTAWYDITEVLGLAAIAVAAGFCVLGALQTVKRRSIRAVDADLCLLGVYFGVLIMLYVLFMFIPVNYRPVIMDGELETSFPSSHTMLVSGIMGAAMIQFSHRVRRRPLLVMVNIISMAVILLTVAGRLLSGVHWATDIIGGVLISGALVTLYAACHPLLAGKSLGDCFRRGRHIK